MSETDPLPPADGQRGLPLWSLQRTIGLALAWLPFFALVVFATPQIVPIFTKLNEKGRLPMISQWILAFGKLDSVWSCVLVLTFFMALVLADTRAVYLARRLKQGGVLYQCWLAIAAGTGVAAALVAVWALFTPGFIMGPMR